MSSLQFLSGVAFEEIPLTIIVVSLAVLAVLLISNVIYLRFFHPLAQIPGPFFAAVTGLWLVLQMRTWKRHRSEISLHKKYGSIVRISPNEVMVSEPRYLKIIYGAGTHFTKAPWYRAVGGEDPNGLDFLGEFNMEKYRLQRRLTGPVFTTQAAKQHERLMDHVLRRYVEMMVSIQGKPQDLVKWMNILAIDLLSEATFGTSEDLIASSDDDGNIEALDEFWKQASVLGHLPWLLRAFQIFKKHVKWKWLRRLVDADIGNARIFHFYMKQIMKRMEDPKEIVDKVDLHTALLQQAEKRPDLRPEWVIGMTMTIMGAGFDTISGALSAYLVFIARTKGCQATLHEELDQARKSGRLDEYPTYDQASQLPYLQASIKESQRLHSAIGMSVPRVVPPEGATIEGHLLPGGTVAGINPWVLHRNRSVFGDDADNFRPQRYIEAPAAKRKEMDSADFTFGGASRSCPGQHLAWVVLSKTCAAIFLHFKIELLTEDEAMQYGHGFKEECFFTVKWEGIWMKMRSRS